MQTVQTHYHQRVLTVQTDPFWELGNKLHDRPLPVCAATPVAPEPASSVLAHLLATGVTYGLLDMSSLLSISSLSTRMVSPLAKKTSTEREVAGSIDSLLHERLRYNQQAPELAAAPQYTTPATPSTTTPRTTV